MMMRTVDLFSGCGGLSLGFQNAGFDVVAAFDHWKPAVEVYRKNFDHPVFVTDLSRNDCIKTIKKFRPQLLIGGPPCQDFSSAGKRDEMLGRADLTLSYSQIVAQCRPEWFVMENVERVTKSSVLKEALQAFRQTGYGLTQQVLDASFCGVPQSRKRFFLIGHLKSDDGFLDDILTQNQKNKPMTVFDYLGETLGIEHYYRHPRSYLRRGIFSIHEPSPTIRGVNRPIPKGYTGHAGDTMSVSETVRPLTTKERSLIQTFPESFVFCGSQTNLEQMIGNAVPVKLANFVAMCIREYIDAGTNHKQQKTGQRKLSFCE